MFEKNLKLASLLDFYGEVLSERKQAVLSLYYNEDLSLAEIAEDILHDSFISLWEKRESVDDFIDYLYITIRNNCLRYRRDTSIHKAVYDKIAQKEQGLMEMYTRTIENCDVANLQEKEVSNIIYDVMSKLSAQDRKIFMMKKFDGKSYKEISEELGITTSVIDHSLRNTTAKMKVALADYIPILLALISVLEK